MRARREHVFLLAARAAIALTALGCHHDAPAEPPPVTPAPPLPPGPFSPMTVDEAALRAALDPEGVAALDVLLTAESFGGTCVSEACSLSIGARALRVLVARPEGRRAFHLIFARGTVPGRLYATAGLYATDGESYEAILETLRASLVGAEPIADQRGCEVGWVAAETRIGGPSGDGLASGRLARRLLGPPWNAALQEEWLASLPPPPEEIEPGRDTRGCPVPADPAPAIVAVSDHGGCRTTRDGRIGCWGRVPFATPEGDLLAAQVRAPVALDVASHLGCLLDAEGRRFCWTERTRWEERGADGNPPEPRFAITPDRTARYVEIALSDENIGQQSRGCARTAKGSVRCFTDDALDGEVIALPGPATALVVGGHERCAIVRSGALYCFREGAAPELRLRGPVRAAAIGTETAIAVDARGETWVWGLGSPGPASENGDWFAPEAYPAMRGAVEVTAGYRHVCARLRSGEVRCYGRNLEGQLGIGTVTESEGAVRVAWLEASIRLEAVGKSTCGLFEGGHLRCAGEGVGGLFGAEARASRTVAVPLLDGNRPVRRARALATTFDSTCYRRLIRWHCVGLYHRGRGLPAIRFDRLEERSEASGIRCDPVDGRVRCENTQRLAPEATRVFLDGPRDVVEVVAAHRWFAARTEDGAIYSWTLDARARPTDIRRGAMRNVRDVTNGGDFLCALSESGEVRCWGFQNSEVIATPDEARPIEDLGEAVEISAGVTHACARIRGGAVRCWGDDARGEIGRAPSGVRSRPVDVKTPGIP